jgi:hypothetical protein
MICTRMCTGSDAKTLCFRYECAKRWCGRGFSIGKFTIQELSMDQKPACVLSLVSMLIDLKEMFTNLVRHLVTLPIEEQDKYLRDHVELWISQVDELMSSDTKNEANVTRLVVDGFSFLKTIGMAAGNDPAKFAN